MDESIPQSGASSAQALGSLTVTAKTATPRLRATLLQVKGFTRRVERIILVPLGEVESMQSEAQMLQIAATPMLVNWKV